MNHSTLRAHSVPTPAEAEGVATSPTPRPAHALAAAPSGLVPAPSGLVPTQSGPVRLADILRRLAAFPSYLQDAGPITPETRFTITQKGREALAACVTVPGCPECGAPVEGE